jgi:hypothetical protein
MTSKEWETVFQTLLTRPGEFINTYKDKDLKLILNSTHCYECHYSTLMHVLFTCTGTFTKKALEEDETTKLQWHYTFSIDEDIAKDIFDFMIKKGSNPYIKNYYSETVIDLIYNDYFLSRRENNKNFINYVKNYFSI